MSPLVGQFMDRDVLAVPADHPLTDCRALLLERRIHCLPVVNLDGQPVGILTCWDLAKPATDISSVGRIMSRTVHTIGPDESVAAAARRMYEERIHHLVVVEDRRVVGVLSSFDLLPLLGIEGSEDETVIL